MLVDYFHHLFEQGRGRSVATDTLSGLSVFLPAAKPYLHHARLSLRGWTSLVPPVPYPPLSWDLTVLISFRLTLCGFPRMAFAVLLSFDCFLRVGELTSLRREDVTLGQDLRLGSEWPQAVLRLARTKTGPNQSVVILREGVHSLLRFFHHRTPPRHFLFPFTPARFRTEFHRACTSLGLSASYVPHSLRHGGATQLFMAGWQLEDIMLRGRWAVSKSARRYIQAGRALLLQQSIPAHLSSVGPLLVFHYLLFFRALLFPGGLALSLSTPPSPRDYPTL